LYIDETGIPENYKMSVGVARQWWGQLGKVDNCQGAVFATLGRGHFSTPIDYRLFMPEAWIKDRDRCKKAKIPEDRIVFKTKHEQAIEMIFSARKNGVRFKWVGFDGFYGDNPAFLRKLADNDVEFMADIHSDHRIYYEDPQPVVPLPKSNKEKKTSKLQAQSRSIRLDRWVAKQSPEAWKRVELRESTKGKLLADILHRQIWVWDGKESCARKWHLIVRREINSPEKIKYSLSNAPIDTPTKRLAFVQTQRYWMERPFQDAKNQCGLGEYQARGWIAWQHHMSMVMLAMLFTLEQRLKNRTDIPLLSCADIATLIKSVLPGRDITEYEIVRQVEVRHRKRRRQSTSPIENNKKTGCCA
jgi:SRSO17 transposase